jgi:hypothetical protein
LPVRFPFKSDRQGVGPFNTLKGSDGRDVIGAHLAYASLSAKKKPIAKPMSGWQVDRPGAKAR